MASNSLTALITGGTSGIGRATANKLATLGIHVLVVGRNTKRGDETLAEIRAAGGKADFISSDLRNASSAREVAKRALELGDGHVDILINNAGIFPFGPTDQTKEEEFDGVYSLNVKVPYFLVAELAPLMAKRGKGAIVSVSTMVADYGVSGMSLYGSSKAAINLLTKSWAAEYGPRGVRVNAVSPGPTRTEGTEAMGEGVEQLAAQAPAGRPATADEIAEAIVFLATDRSSFIYGAKLAVDGGRTASEMFQRFRKRRVRVLLKCPFSLLAHRVPVGMDLAHCSPLNWTEDSAEPLLRMIALPIRVASPSIQTKTCCF
jgi:NAD(P)-dependent dehydrogenase (short-subunit alcohol dehydrogenase family)